MQQWDGHRPTLLCPCTWQRFDFPVSHPQTLSYEHVTPTPIQAQQAGGQGIPQERPPSLHTQPASKPALFPLNNALSQQSHTLGPARATPSPSSPDASTTLVSLERGTSGALAMPHTELLPPHCISSPCHLHSCLTPFQGHPVLSSVPLGPAQQI